MAAQHEHVHDANTRADLAVAQAREYRAKLELLALKRVRRQFKERLSRPARRGPLNAAGSYGANSRTGLSGSAARTASTHVSLGGSADYHLDAIRLRDLRRDSDHAVRSNPAAALIVETLVDHVVGDGVSFMCQHSDQEFNRKKKALLEEYAANEAGGRLNAGHIDARGPAGETLDERLAQIVRDLMLDGSALEIYTESGSLAAVEAQRFTSPKGPFSLSTFQLGKGGWVSGVELGPFGELLNIGVGQFMLDGGAAALRFDEKNFQTFSLTDGSAMLLRCPIGKKRNQTIGEPGMARILSRLSRLEGIDDAVLENFRIAASFTAMITTPNPGALMSMLPGINEPRSVTIAGGGGSGTATGPGVDAQREIEPGMINVFGEGTDAKQLQAVHPSAQYNPFVMFQFGVCAALVGVPWILALMDGSVSNYSGFRSAMGLGYKRFYKWRQMLTRYLHWLERHLTARWIREGKLPMVQDWDARSTIQWPPMPVLDPGKEVMAANMQVRSGLGSRKEAILQLSGRDINDVDRERVEEVRRERKEGLTGTGAEMPERVQSESTVDASGQSSGDAGEDRNGQSPAGGSGENP